MDQGKNFGELKLNVFLCFHTFLFAFVCFRLYSHKFLHDLREDISRKKNVFFRALPESPKPPPPNLNSGNLVLFFGRQKRCFARMTEKKSF